MSAHILLDSENVFHEIPWVEDEYDRVRETLRGMRVRLAKRGGGALRQIRSYGKHFTLGVGLFDFVVRTSSAYTPIEVAIGQPPVPFDRSAPRVTVPVFQIRVPTGNDMAELQLIDELVEAIRAGTIGRRLLIGSRDWRVLKAVSELSESVPDIWVVFAPTRRNERKHVVREYPRLAGRVFLLDEFRRAGIDSRRAEEGRERRAAKEYEEAQRRTVAADDNEVRQSWEAYERARRQ